MANGLAARRAAHGTERTAGLRGPARRNGVGTAPINVEHLQREIVSLKEIITTAQSTTGLNPRGREAAFIRKAYAYAERKHEGQSRESGRPYVEHPARAALYVAAIGGDYLQIAGALLHDVMEDCGVSYAELKREFGRATARMVTDLTKPKWDGRRWVFADQAQYAYMLSRHDAGALNTKLITAGEAIDSNPQQAKRLCNEVMISIERTTGKRFYDDAQVSIPLETDALQKRRAQLNEWLKGVPQDRYQPAMDDERDEFYFGKLQTARGIKALIVKACETLTNLEEMSSLPAERRERNLGQIIGRMLKILVRLDYGLFDRYVTALECYPDDLQTLGHGLKDGRLDRAQFVTVSEDRKIRVLPPRERLNEKMIGRLPIRYPGHMVISVYVNLENVHQTGRLEIGLPRVNGNGQRYKQWLDEQFSGMELQVTPVRSMLLPSMDASEHVYRVEGFASSRRDSALKKLDGFLARLDKLYDKHLAQHHQPPPFAQTG